MSRGNRRDVDRERARKRNEKKGNKKNDGDKSYKEKMME